MARVLISCIGAVINKENEDRTYTRATYKFDNAEYKTPFFAAALSEHLKVDKIFLIGTSKSMWEGVYEYFATKIEKMNLEYWTRVGDAACNYKHGDSKIAETQLEQVNLAMDGYLQKLNASASGGSQCCVIEYGIDEKELWNNFDCIMQIVRQLEQNDEIYMDITHGFRSIPLFMYLMMELVQILHFKEKNLKGLYYGMLEATKDLGYAPVVDLKSFFDISSWIRGSHEFITYGNAYLLSELIVDEKVKAKIKNISDLVNISFIDDLKKEIDSLRSLMERKDDVDPVIRHMRPELERFTDWFKGVNSASQLQFKLAKWYFENSRYSSCYICLAESIITRLLEVYQQNGTERKNRKKIKILIYSEKFRKELSFKVINQLYNKISGIRNNIAHAGFADNAAKGQVSDYITSLSKYLNEVDKHIINNKMERLPVEFPFNQIESLKSR